MLKNDEASVDRRGVTEDLLPVSKHLTDGCGSTSDIKICFTDDLARVPIDL
jgi:hypothetical protein